MCSLADAMAHHLNDTKITNLLIDRANALSKSHECLVDIQKLAKEHFPNYSQHILCHPENPNKAFDPLADLSEFPTIVVPQGTDFSCEHCIGLVGDTVFESNHEEAKKLSKKLLDWCCSFHVNEAMHLQTHFAMRLIPSPFKVVGDCKKNFLHSA